MAVARLLSMCSRYFGSFVLAPSQLLTLWVTGEAAGLQQHSAAAATSAGARVCAQRPNWRLAACGTAATHSLPLEAAVQQRQRWWKPLGECSLACSWRMQPAGTSLPRLLGLQLLLPFSHFCDHSHALPAMSLTLDGRCSAVAAVAQVLESVVRTRWGALPDAQVGAAPALPLLLLLVPAAAAAVPLDAVACCCVRLLLCPAAAAAPGAICKMRCTAAVRCCECPQLRACLRCSWNHNCACSGPLCLHSTWASRHTAPSSPSRLSVAAVLPVLLRSFQ